MELKQLQPWGFGCGAQKAVLLAAFSIVTDTDWYW